MDCIHTDLLYTVAFWHLRFILVYEVSSRAHNYCRHPVAACPQSGFWQYCSLATARWPLDIQPTRAVDPCFLVFVGYIFLYTTSRLLLFVAPGVVPIPCLVCGNPLLAKAFILCIALALKDTMIEQQICLLLLFEAGGALFAKAAILQIAHC